MKPITYKFTSGSGTLYFDQGFASLQRITGKKDSILLTDENVFEAQRNKFRGWNVIVLKAGEKYKVQHTVDAVISQLIAMKADRKTTLVGVGGGVITDLAGYIASTYMRGIPFGFVPTSLLGMVDASIGGKNGVDVEDYKNMVGTIRQPSFILHDYSFLNTLPRDEWRNGFAEIIKHACIGMPGMFSQLSSETVSSVRKNKKLLANLVKANARYKLNLVKRDEFEKGERKKLNFGHTIGHALETQYELSHGQAISLGMVGACRLSEALMGFKHTEKVVSLIERFDLPTNAGYNKGKMLRVMSMDKKKAGNQMNFILLEKIGKSVIHPIPVAKLGKLIERLI